MGYFSLSLCQKSLDQISPVHSCQHPSTKPKLGMAIGVGPPRASCTSLGFPFPAVAAHSSNAPVHHKYKSVMRTSDYKEGRALEWERISHAADCSELEMPCISRSSRRCGGHRSPNAAIPQICVGGGRLEPSLMVRKLRGQLWTDGDGFGWHGCLRVGWDPSQHGWKGGSDPLSRLRNCKGPRKFLVPWLVKGHTKQKLLKNH